MVGTFIANRNILASEKLLFDKIFDRGTFKTLVSRQLGVVITIQKDSITLKVVSTKMNKGVGKINMRKGRESTTEK